MEVCRPLRVLVFGLSVATALAGCKHHSNDGDDTAIDAPYVADACEGLQCFIVDCQAKGLPTTSLSGTVYAPNGTLPLFGVNVYVPITDPGALPDGAQCDRCANGLPGGAYAQATTDETGHFTLPNVPATANVPVIVQVGKWRRRFTVPNVAACQDLPIDPAITRLPKNKSEGDIPLMAITTGNADALECLPYKLGVDEAEFTTDAGTGRVHLFSGNGTDRFKPALNAGAVFPAATTLWGTVAKLKTYDITLLSCEGGQNPATKPQTAMQAVHDYAGLGGRVFMSHWHNIWIGGESGNLSHGLADWETIGTWNYGAPQDQENTIASVDQTVTKGVSFAKWLMNVAASTVLGQIPISGARYTLPSADKMKSDRRVYLEPALSNNHLSVQDLEFTTPNDVAADQRCGKVVFSDMHVASGSSSVAGAAGKPFPTGCSATPLSPQEKALAFIFFDISSCVGSLQ